MLATEYHPENPEIRHSLLTKPIVIRRNAWIGANATIVCGCEIGRYALVGAGAVVTKSVPDYALMVGNPAVQIGWVSACGHKLAFDKNGRAVCPESGEQYQLTQNVLVKIENAK